MTFRLKQLVRFLVTKSLVCLFGDGYRIHRVPFGLLAGRYLYTSPSISIRMFLGFDEVALLRIARLYIKPGMVVYDIGAHIGYTSVFFASLTGVNGAVHSFELVPSTAEMLKKTVVANGFAFCTVHQVGVSDHTESLPLQADVNRLAVVSQKEARQATADAPFEVCRIVRLDDYIEDCSLASPAFIKMDVEHEDVRALYGMEKMIDRCRPVFIIEFHSATLLKDGFEFFSAKGYKMLTLEQQLISLQSIAGMSQFWNNVLCLPSSAT